MFLSPSFSFFLTSYASCQPCYLCLQPLIYDCFIGVQQKEDPDLFSGLIWTGKRALQLGLIDELGDIDSVMKQDFGEDIKIVPIKSKYSVFFLFFLPLSIYILVRLKCLLNARLNCAHFSSLKCFLS